MSGSRRLRLYSKIFRVLTFGPGTVFIARDEDMRKTSNIESIEIVDKCRRICDSISRNLDSPYMDKDELKAWHKEIVDGTVGAANCLMLTLLPSVEKMTVCELDPRDSEMSDMICKISKTNEEASSLTWEKLSLVKLQEVTMLSASPIGRGTTRSGLLEALMTLPSLRILRGRNFGRRYEFNQWVYPGHYSNVTQLHFCKCALAGAP